MFSLIIGCSLIFTNSLILTYGSPIDSFASEVKSWMDLSQNPCDEFYTFSCGNYRNNETATETHPNDIFQFVKEQFSDIINIFNEPINENEVKPLKMARIYYKACTNKEQMEKNGLTDLKQVFEAMGGFPAVSVDQWNADQYSWTELSYKLRKNGFLPDGLISIQVVTPESNFTTRMIAIDSPTLGVSLNSLKEGRGNLAVKQHLSTMIKMLIAFGADKTTAKIDMTLVLDLEISLAQAMRSYDERRNSTAQSVFTIGDLEKTFPSIPWLEYINNMLPSNTTRVNVTDNVIVRDVEYLKKLDAIMANTPKRVLANYQMWKPLFMVRLVLNEDVMKMSMDDFLGANDLPRPNKRENECLMLLSMSVPALVGALYARKYHNPESNINATELVDIMQTAFIRHLSEFEWMDPKTKALSINKAKALEKYIGYPEELFNDTMLLDVYGSLEFDEDHFILCALKVIKLVLDLEYGRFRDPVKGPYWPNYLPSVNSYYATYVATDNALDIPADVLTSRLFDKSHPMFANFGSLGMLIGSELNLGLTGRGQDYDDDGFKADWWTKESKEKFKNEMKCIEDDCKKVASKIGVNTTVCNENVIGLFNGLYYAHSAYKHWVTQNGMENKLPNLDYTGNQMFWVSAAQTMCSTRPSERDQSRAVNVIVSMRNNAQFSEDWNCPTDAELNPQVKCTVH